MQNINPGRFFVIVAIIFGLLFIMLTPPFEAPDEPVHFFRSYQVSTFNLSVDKVGNTYGGVLPKSLQDTVALTWDKPGLAFRPNIKYSLGYTKQALYIKTTPEKHVYDFSTTGPYSPVSYTPQALGVGLARLLKLPPILMMYSGRVFNLLAWVAMFYLAIRLMPRKKWALVFLGVLPMALFQAASLSADVMAIGLLAITLAWILKLKDSKRKILADRELVTILITLTLLTLSKQIMFLFLGLIFLLPGRLFKSRRHEILLKSCFVILPLIIFGLWMLHVKGIPLSTSVGSINPVGQEKFIIKNPHSFINVLWNTYFYSWGDGITRSFIGNFGWVDTPLSEALVTIGYISLFLLIVANDAKQGTWLNRKSKFIILTLITGYFAAVSAALYVYFTPVGFKIVVGLVGRYYIPIAILLIPLVYGSWLTMTKMAYRRIAVLSPLFLLICSIITIFVRYYVNNV